MARAWRLMGHLAGLVLVGRVAAEGLSPEDLAHVRADEAARIASVEKVYGTVVAMYGRMVGRGGGSGVLVDEAGFALTNYHVVRAAGRSGKAGLADGRLYDWRLWGMDPGGDLALVRLSGRPRFPAAELGDSRAVRVGDFCLAMGNPFVLAEDQKPTVTLGIVSGVERFQHGQTSGTLVYGNCIQIDTSINPGNSGGPLFDAAGRLIGINGRGSFEERGRVNVGVGYAVSTEQAANFLPDLLATKLCEHASLNATFLDLEGKVVCDQVNLDSPVGQAGLRPGDELAAFSGRPIRTANQYLNLLTTLPAHWPVAVTFRRRGEETTAHVRLTPLPYPQAARRPPTPPRVQPKDGPPGEGPKEAEPPKPGHAPKPDDAPEPEKGGQGKPGRPRMVRLPAEERLRAEPGKIMDAALNREACQWVLARYAAWLGGPASPGRSPDGLKRAAAAETGEVARALALAALAAEPAETFKTLELEGGDKAAGRRAFRIRAENKAGEKALFWFSLPWEDGRAEARLLKVAQVARGDPPRRGDSPRRVAPDADANGQDQAWTFHDWRQAQDWRVPHAVRRVRGLEERVEATHEVGAGPDSGVRHPPPPAPPEPAPNLPPWRVPARRDFQDAIAYAQKRCVRLYGGGAGREHGYATGLLVSDDGLVLTAQGMVLTGARVRAVLPDGSVREAEVVRRSEPLQAALLKVDARTPDFFDLASESPVRQGDICLAVSNLFNVATAGEPLSVSLGVVSVRAEMEARHRAQDVPYEGEIILVDAITSNPGAPGGALIAPDGRLAGMLGKLFQSTSTNTRINYAVPVELLKAFVEGRDSAGAAVPPAPAREPYVGLRLFVLSGKTAPAYVDAVVAGSPAARAGLRRDDLILAIGSDVVRNCGECQDALKALKVGVPVAFIVKRKMAVLSLSVTPQERPEDGAAQHFRFFDFRFCAGGEWPRAVAVQSKIPKSEIENAVLAGAGAALEPSPLEAAPVPAPKAFRAAVAKVLPSVVTIETYGGVLMPERPSAPRPSPARGPRRPRGRRRITAIGNPGEGPTTGLIVSPDGTIVTSTYNFLRAPPIITVVLPDGSRHVAKLCGRDETRRLCLLKIEGVEGLPVPDVVPRDELRVGQWAISVGVGYGGDEPAISAGIVSALDRISGKAVQTDANLSPANYGGPLVDLRGRVIGVCVPLSPRAQGPAAGVEWYDSGIGFAIPLAGADPLIERMKKGETIRAGRLGIRPALQAPPGSVPVEQVLPDSPAAKAGIKPKDAILALNGEPVSDVFRLRVILGRYAAGDEVTVRLKRGQEELSVKVVLDAGEDQVPQPMPFEVERQRRRDGRPDDPSEPKE